MSESLRQFAGVHIDEDCAEMHSVQFDNHLFHGCVFDDLRGLTLKDCVLDRSKFKTDSVRKALGFTLTLDCHSFKDVQFSPLLIDLLLYLLTTTKGNDEKREQVVGLLGKERVHAFERLLKGVE
jgi:hypothetical protein